jgi:hypothetical protein
MGGILLVHGEFAVAHVTRYLAIVDAIGVGHIQAAALVSQYQQPYS